MGSIRALHIRKNLVETTQRRLRTTDRATVTAGPLLVSTGKVGFTRLNCEPHIYNRNALNVFMFANVYDILTFGVEERLHEVMIDMSK